MEDHVDLTGLDDSEIENSPFVLEPGENACGLNASGFSYTLNGVYDWATQAANLVQETLGTHDLNAHLRAYREQGYESMCLTIWKDDLKDRCDFNFTLGEKHDFHLEEPYVPDANEALHMIGILTQTLNVKVEIGGHRNETNRYCTPKPWRKGQTNAPLKVILKQPLAPTNLEQERNYMLSHQSGSFKVKAEFMLYSGGHDSEVFKAEVFEDGKQIILVEAPSAIIDTPLNEEDIQKVLVKYIIDYLNGFGHCEPSELLKDQKVNHVLFNSTWKVM